MMQKPSPNMALEGDKPRGREGERHRARKAWRAMSALGVVFSSAAVLLTVVLFVRVQEQREERQQDQSAAAFENCARNNYQDQRDRAQDKLLLDLVKAARGIGGKNFQQVAPFAQRVLEERIHEPPHNGILLMRYARMPRDCTKLPTQRKFSR